MHTPRTLNADTSTTTSTVLILLQLQLKIQNTCLVKTEFVAHFVANFVAMATASVGEKFGWQRSTAELRKYPHRCKNFAYIFYRRRICLSQSLSQSSLPWQPGVSKA